jgi:hypothetical protein
VDLYFTFPDGGLTYDCPSCRQLCCRGKGFAIGAGELIQLAKRAPEVVPHLYLRGGDSFGVFDFTDACWMLADNGNCGLEVRHGRAAKPSTCRLFPFNRVFRVGEVRIIDMNSSLCPLQASGNGVRWSDITREIDEVIALGGSPLVDIVPTSPLDLAGDWVATERKLFGSDPLAPAGDLARAWSRLYGVGDEERAALEQLVAPLVTLLAPSLRFSALFNKHGGLYSEHIEVLPKKIRALAFLAALGARATPPTLRSLTEIWQMQSGAIDVLAHFDEPVHLLQPKFDADLPAMMQPALGVLLGGAFRGGKTLGELVELAAGTLDQETRPLAVALAASQLSTLFPYGV